MATIRTRKRGKTWSYSFEVGKNPETGRRKMKEKGGFASQDEAYDAGVEAYADWKHGNIGITSDKVLLDDFFKSWLENVVKPNVKFGTVYQYERRYYSVISPSIGKMYIQDIRPRNVDAIIRKMAAEGKGHDTIQSVLTVMRSMFKYAVYPAELIASNPALNVSVPRSARRKIVERRVISREELDGVLAGLQKRKKGFCRIPILLGYYAGLRIGEALGLCWDDIDFETNSISITKTLYRLQKTSYVSTTKTISGDRTIIMPRFIAEMLQDYRRLSAYTSEERIIPITRAALLKKLHEGAKKAGVKEIRIHDLRHSHASLLIKAHCTPVEVADRLGHKDPSITLRIYSHMYAAQRTKLADMLDDMRE